MSLAARTSLAGHPHTRARGPNPAIPRSGMVPVVATTDRTPASAHRRIPEPAQAEGRVPPDQRAGVRHRVRVRRDGSPPPAAGTSASAPPTRTAPAVRCRAHAPGIGMRESCRPAPASASRASCGNWLGDYSRSRHSPGAAGEAMGYAAGLACLRCWDFECVEDAADGLVGADQGQHVGDAPCPEHRGRLVVDGPLDAPLDGQLVGEPPGGLLGGGQLAGPMAGRSRADIPAPLAMTRTTSSAPLMCCLHQD